MAIKIPSKNIYDKKTQIVRDNVIERIEVNALEITKKNVYGTTAYEEAKGYLEEQQIEIRDWADNDFNSTDGENVLAYAFVACNVISKDYYNLIPELIVPKQNENKSIKKIRSLGYSIAGIKNTYSCTGKFTAQPTAGSGGHYFHEDFDIGQQIEEEGINGSIYESVIENSATGTLKDTKELSATAKVNPMDWSDVPQTYEVYENYYIFKNIKVLVKKEVLKLQAESDEAGLKGQATTHEASGTYIEYIPDNIVLNVNGDIVTIEIKDKVVYIPDGDKTSKKVIRFESNELMQTSNYTAGETDNAITDKFGVVKNLYANGKETVTIRCSISDYYEYNEPFIKRISPSEKDFTSKIAVSFEAGSTNSDVTISTKNGETYSFPITVNIKATTATVGLPLSLSITLNPNESTTTKKVLGNIGSVESFVATADYKMAFDEYDTVIPMVYGADGIDRPMSLDKNKQPKEFSVLGTKIFYDGAVWQELYLQET